METEKLEKSGWDFLEGKINIVSDGLIMRDNHDDYWVSDLQ